MHVCDTLDISLSQKLTTKIFIFISTRFLTKTKIKVFIRRFNNISKITIEKNIYNQLFEFYFDENNIMSQLNIRIQRIINVAINNYIVKHFSQFDLSKSSNFSNFLKFQNFVENDDDNNISK